MQTIEESLQEILTEQNWALHRRFMQEVEAELGCRVSPELLICCQNVALKWLEYVSKN